MKKKWIIFSNSLDCGGVEKALVSLLKNIDYQSYEVDLLLMNRSGIWMNEIPNEVNILDTPDYFDWMFIKKERVISSIVSLLKYPKILKKYIDIMITGIKNKSMAEARQQIWKELNHSVPKIDKKYDMAIDFSGCGRGLIANNIDAKKKITWIHSDYNVYMYNEEIDKEFLAKFDYIVAVSDTCKDIFIKKFPMYKNKTKLIQNISDKEYIMKQAKESVEFDSNYKGTKIISMSRLDPNKGLELAVEACSILVKEGYDIRWYVLGDGVYRRELEKLIDKYKMKDNFKLLGLKSNPYPYLKHADIFAHCSLFEGKSVAIDEALILEKPIVVTNYPTVKDQIKHKYNGIIVELQSKDIYEGIKLLIEDDGLRSSLLNNIKDLSLDVERIMDEVYSLN